MRRDSFEFLLGSRKLKTPFLHLHLQEDIHYLKGLRMAIKVGVLCISLESGHFSKALPIRTMSWHVLWYLTDAIRVRNRSFSNNVGCQSVRKRRKRKDKRRLERFSHSLEVCKLWWRFPRATCMILLQIDCRWSHDRIFFVVVFLVAIGSEISYISPCYIPSKAGSRFLETVEVLLKEPMQR
ncbi:hypothetical protein TWF694_000796 [Orbilia ellipsospora]|uniref:Uncharacterized protein n=1 Tax=Orbilia ellipsospora TaxID=2528407 RepID=A0AAV9XPQ4_9PEZI